MEIGTLSYLEGYHRLEISNFNEEPKTTMI